MPDAPRHKAYSQVRDDARDLLRRNVVEAADHLLMTEGPEALTVRRIADELNASTKVLYSLFEGKDGLANALYLEGCARLRDAIGQVPLEGELRAYIVGCCRAYWAFAQANPGYYGVMFGNAIPHFEPDQESLATVTTAFGKLIETLTYYQAQGQLPTRTIPELVHLIWAPIHGVISLLHGRHLTEDEAIRLYESVVAAVTVYVLGPV